MTNRKSTKRALLGSVMAMVLCLAMLVGATFAWFTDTASTGVNKIQAGNLDVALEYSTDFKTWNKVTDTTKLFEDSTVWEPGRTEVVYLRVKNAGTLALKYTVGMYNINEGRGKNVAGEYYYLSNYVKLGAVETTAAYADREAAINAVNAEARTLKSIGSSAIIGEDQMVMLAPKADAKTYALVLYMPTEVGNEANPKNNDPYWASKFSFGISVNATQAEYENDSYDNTYDHDAPELFSAESFSYGTHEITKNIQANGRYGAVQAEKTAQITIDADVYAVYTKGKDGQNAAMAVEAGGTSKVIIKGGDFRQVDVPADDPICDLIYATDKATIEIQGGTFKAVTPANTLNVIDSARGVAKIIVSGGSFYKYDPSHPAMGENEVFVADGYHVVQNGDWYTVVKN